MFFSIPFTTNTYLRNVKTGVMNEKYWWRKQDMIQFARKEARFDDRKRTTDNIWN